MNLTVRNQLSFNSLKQNEFTASKRIDGIIRAESMETSFKLGYGAGEGNANLSVR